MRYVPGTDRQGPPYIFLWRNRRIFGATDKELERLSELISWPCRYIARDLIGVVVEVGGIDPEPVLGGVVPGLGVAAASAPRFRREGTGELGSASPGGHDRVQCYVDGPGVVVQ